METQYYNVAAATSCIPVAPSAIPSTAPAPPEVCVLPEQDLQKLISLFQKKQSGGVLNLNKTEFCDRWLNNESCRFHERGFCKYAHGIEDAFPREFKEHSFKEQYCGKEECAYSDLCKFVHDDVRYILPQNLILYYSEKERTYRLVFRKEEAGTVLVYKFPSSQTSFFKEFLPIFEEVRRKGVPNTDFRPANLEKARLAGLKVFKNYRDRSKSRDSMPKQRSKRRERYHNHDPNMIHATPPAAANGITWVPVLNGQVLPMSMVGTPPAAPSVPTPTSTGTVFYTPSAAHQSSPPMPEYNHLMSWGTAMAPEMQMHMYPQHQPYGGSVLTTSSVPATMYSEPHCYPPEPHHHHHQQSGYMQQFIQSQNYGYMYPQDTVAGSTPQTPPAKPAENTRLYQDLESFHHNSVHEQFLTMTPQKMHSKEEAAASCPRGVDPRSHMSA